MDANVVDFTNNKFKHALLSFWITLIDSLYNTPELFFTEYSLSKSLVRQLLTAIIDEEAPDFSRQLLTNLLDAADPESLELIAEKIFDGRESYLSNIINYNRDDLLSVLYQHFGDRVLIPLSPMSGMNIVHIAAERNNRLMLEKMVEIMGARVLSISDKRGRTAFDFGNEETEAFMQELL